MTVPDDNIFVTLNVLWSVLDIAQLPLMRPGGALALAGQEVSNFRNKPCAWSREPRPACVCEHVSEETNTMQESVPGCMQMAMCHSGRVSL